MPSLNARNLQRLRETPKFSISVAVGHCSRQPGGFRPTPSCSHQRTHAQAFWFALLPTSRNFIADWKTQVPRHQRRLVVLFAVANRLKATDFLGKTNSHPRQTFQVEVVEYLRCWS